MTRKGIFGPTKKLEFLSHTNEYRSISDRIEAVILHKKGLSYRKIGNLLRRSERWSHYWVQRYKSVGVKGLFDLQRSGRPSYLSIEQENKFEIRIENGPLKEDGVSVFNGPFIKKILKEEYNVTYSNYGVNKLLHRLGFEKIMPRPVHEKNDVAKMEEWKNETLPDFYGYLRKKK